jgi:hypothetical protein
MPTPSETFLANPDISQFVDRVVTFLNAEWTTLLASGFIALGTQSTVTKLDPMFFANASTAGSCNTSCASAVVTDVQGLSSAVFSKIGAKAQFEWCANNQILISLPMTCTNVSCTLNLQGYSASSGAILVGLDKSVVASSPVRGSALIVLPWVPTSLGPQVVTLEDAKITLSI